jgi:hypothetical protein
MSESNGVNPIVIVLVAGVLLLVAAGAVMSLWGTAAHSPPRASSSATSAFQSFRCEKHPDETLALSEVTLSVDGRELVRRAVWGTDSVLDAEASGFFVAGARIRPLSAIEVEDLMQLAAVDALDVHASVPSSLLAKD